jgi:hypothetical protein
MSGPIATDHPLIVDVTADEGISGDKYSDEDLPTQQIATFAAATLTAKQVAALRGAARPARAEARN